jgi:hypothetical protein
LKNILVIFLFLVLAQLPTRMWAQGQDKAVIFTGIVVGGHNSEPLPSAYVFNSSAGRGTISNANGYFIINVFPGDSVVFSYVGFKKQYHIIPKKIEQNYSAIVDMKEDVQTLAEVRVYPYSSEELFKEAFLAYKLPDAREREALAKATDQRYLAALGYANGMGAMANYRGFLESRQNYQNNKTFVNTQLLSPTAWASFIKSVKNGDLTRKDWKGITDVQVNETLPRERFQRKN